MAHRRWSLWTKLGLAASLTALLALPLVSMGGAGAQTTSSPAGTVAGDGIGAPQFATVAPGSAPNNPVTIPYWSSSFSYQGVTYPYTMVGTDPSLGSATTTIPVVIVPLSFTFSNGVSLDGTTEVANTVASPIFQSAHFSSGNTQFGDAMQRAEFWSDVQSVSPNYHVLFGSPTVLATQSYAVPANQGLEFTGSVSGQPIGLLSDQWFTQKLGNLMVSLHISPRTIPIFLTFDTFLYVQSLSQCCVLGYHGATTSLNGQGMQSVSTFIFAAYNNPGIFGTIPGYAPIEDIAALSHEVAELMNDPFVSNVVPPWSVPAEPQYGCSNLLEVGDPLVAYDYTVYVHGTPYHPEDIAFAPWFEKSPTSSSIHGQYTYLGTYTTYAPGC